MVCYDFSWHNTKFSRREARKRAKKTHFSLSPALLLDRKTMRCRATRAERNITSIFETSTALAYVNLETPFNFKKVDDSLVYWCGIPRLGSCHTFWSINDYDHFERKRKFTMESDGGDMSEKKKVRVGKELSVSGEKDLKTVLRAKPFTLHTWFLPGL